MTPRPALSIYVQRSNGVSDRLRARAADVLPAAHNATSYCVSRATDQNYGYDDRMDVLDRIRAVTGRRR